MEERERKEAGKEVERVRRKTGGKEEGEKGRKRGMKRGRPARKREKDESKEQRTKTRKEEKAEEMLIAGVWKVRVCVCVCNPPWSDHVKDSRSSRRTLLISSELIEDRFCS